MNAGHDEEFRRLFVAEATEQLDRLGDTMIALEREGGGDEHVASLFRDAHTLKSSAALVGLPAVAEVAHELEDLLGELRAGRRAVNARLADGVLAVVDALRALIAAGLAGAAGEEHVAAARAGLERARDGVGSPGSGPAGAPYADERFRVLFVEETVPELDRLTEAALELERRGPEPELVASLFRGAHGLKGSAAAVGFDDVARLAHRLEDRLDELRSGAREASPGLVDAILAVFDAVREAAPALAAGRSAGAALAPGIEAVDALDREAGGERAGEPERADSLAPAIVRPPALVPAAALASAPPAPPPPAESPPAVAPSPSAPESPPAAPPPSAARSAAPDPERLVPVGLDRLDGLVRASGEAVAAGLRLAHLLRDQIAGDPDAEAAALQLHRVLAGVQEQTMRTRMTTFESVAGSLRRAVRDVARASGKDVDYGFEGERVELDRAVLDGLRDPLLHLVRNAIDHGLERPDVRTARGKPPTGSVRVVAERRGPEISIAVVDDGRGLDLDVLRAAAGRPDLDDAEAADAAFLPGLSTADAVTDISGRGVGLDAVRTAVTALRGHVEVASTPGHGCRFTVTVPLTLAVVPCVLLRAAGERYHLPTHAAVTIAGSERDAEVGLEGGAGLWVGDEIVPVTDLAAALGAGGRADGPALVMEAPDGRRHAFRVDAVLGQRDVTVKELGGLTPRSALVAGASIEPDGSVVLLLDPAALVAASGRAAAAVHGIDPIGAEPSNGQPPASTPAPAHVLVVDDALTVRELQRAILERAGYAVTVAVDGREALALLETGRPDLVITDVEMPRVDGYELTTAIRDRVELRSLPVLMVTSMAGDEDRRRGLDAGADAYIVKQDFDADRLLDAVSRLLGR